jgi:uncharacterized Zn finger protein (UPF0148 family)
MNCIDHGSYPGEGSCPVCSGLEQAPEGTKPPKKSRKSQASRRLRQIQPPYMIKQAKTILAREMERLLDASHLALLTRDQAVSLRGYIELLNEIKELDKIEALEKQTKKEKKNV